MAENSEKPKREDPEVHQNIKIYTEHYPPYNMKNNDGKLEGSAIEGLDAVLKQMALGKITTEQADKALSAVEHASNVIEVKELLLSLERLNESNPNQTHTA